MSAVLSQVLRVRVRLTSQTYSTFTFTVSYLFAVRPQILSQNEETLVFIILLDIWKINLKVIEKPIKLINVVNHKPGYHQYLNMQYSFKILVRQSSDLKSLIIFNGLIAPLIQPSNSLLTLRTNFVMSINA